MNVEWFERTEWFRKTKKVKTIIFVCYGNTCRSPTAEYFFREKTSWWDGIKAYSRGMIDNREGENFTTPEIKKVVGNRVSRILDHHRSKKIHHEELEQADLVLGITKSIRDQLKSLSPENAYKIFTLKGFVLQTEDNSLSNLDIKDPYCSPEEKKAQNIVHGTVNYYHFIQNYKRTVLMIEELVIKLIHIIYHINKIKK